MGQVHFQWEASVSAHPTRRIWAAGLWNNICLFEHLSRFLSWACRGLELSAQRSGPQIDPMLMDCQIKPGRNDAATPLPGREVVAKPPTEPRCGRRDSSGRPPESCGTAVNVVSETAKSAGRMPLTCRFVPSETITRSERGPGGLGQLRGWLVAGGRPARAARWPWWLLQTASIWFLFLSSWAG